MSRTQVILHVDMDAFYASVEMARGDEELPAFLPELVSDLLSHERRGREEELQLGDSLQLLAERFEREDRERRRGDTHLGTRLDLGLEIVAQQIGDVVDDPHAATQCPRRGTEQPRRLGVPSPRSRRLGNFQRRPTLWAGMAFSAIQV